MATARLAVQPVEVNFALKDKVYDALKSAVTAMNIYAEAEEPRLDERQLSEDLGVSRTPIREAIARLEQEGLVRTAPRKGVYVVRKTKKEILEMIMVWAALESMAARLITLNAGDDEIASLRRLFATFEGVQAKARIDEYSDANLEFHQAILKMSLCDLLNRMAENPPSSSPAPCCFSPCRRSWRGGGASEASPNHPADRRPFVGQDRLQQNLYLV